MTRTRKHGSERVTLANVAEHAGVSITTVSLILSGRKEWLCQFHPDTIAKVHKSAERLGYRANIFASGLPSRARLFFALVVHDVDGPTSMLWHHWAFEGAFMDGVIQRATERELYPILVTAGVAADEERLRPVEQVIDGGVFGAIVRTPNPLLEKFISARVKRGQRLVVVFPRKLAAWPFNAIDVDNRSLGQTVGRLLAGRARKRWAFVRYKVLQDTHRLRLEGLRQMADEAGAALQVLQLPLGIDEQTGGDFLASRLRRTRADALFSVDSISSVAALLGCLRKGMRAAEDFDLVGCDCSLWHNEPMPRITAVDISWKNVGVLATDRLLEISDSTEPRFETVLLTPRVVPGGTCPVPAGFQPVAAGKHQTVC